MNTLNATENRDLITAIRIAYRVANLLPLEEGSDHTRFIARAWRDSDRDAVFMGLGAVQFALSNLVGTYDAYAELRGAIAKASHEQYQPTAVAA